MLDIMYEIPKDDNIGMVTITKDYVEEGQPGHHTARLHRYWEYGESADCSQQLIIWNK